MIVNLILNILYGIVSGIIALFEAIGTIPSDSNITSAINMFGSYLSPLDNILPITTILSIIAFDVLFESGYFTYKLIRWAYSKIPGVN